MEAGDQHLGHPGSDLLWREVRHADHLASNKVFGRVQRRDLRAGAFHLAPFKLHPETVGGLAGFGEGLGADDGAYAQLPVQKVVEGDVHALNFSNFAE